MDKHIREHKLLCIVIISFLFIVWGERRVFTVSTGIGNRTLQLVFTLCMLTFLSMLFWYLSECSKENEMSMKKHYLFLFVIQTIAFMPMLTQNFSYGDDLWAYMYDYDGQIGNGLYYSRPFVSFLRGPLLNTSFLYIRYYRIYNSFILFFFGCVILKYLTSVTKNKNFAITVASIMTCSCAAVDCIAYASIAPINISLLLSAVGFIAYDIAQAETDRKKNIFYVISVICLFSAFCMYQIGTPIFFVMYVIREKYNKEIKESKRFTNFLHVLILYGNTAIAYLLGTKFFQYITGVRPGQSSRSQIAITLNTLQSKSHWFIHTVIPQSMTRVISSLFGSTLFIENNMFYKCNYTSGIIQTLISIVILLLMFISIMGNAIKKKSIVYLLIAMMTLPLSFWPFLVLPESNYVTYYAMPIIMLVMWYVCDGIYLICDQCIYILKRINDKKHYLTCMMMVIIFIIALQSNYYTENAWVNYSRDSYEYLANSIATKVDSLKAGDTIMVEGNINPHVGGRAYVIAAVKTILIELEYNPDDYAILQTNSPYYISLFDDGEAGKMRQILGSQVMDELLQYYFHDDMYNRWLWASKEVSEEEYVFLHGCFVQTGQLPEDEKNAIIIDMKGFNNRNSF